MLVFYREGEMFFCEKCNYLMNENKCFKCGKSNLRKVREDDFCYFATLHAFKTNIFEGNLKVNNIPVAVFGQGYDYATKKSSEYNIFIPYKFFKEAKEIYRLMFED